MHKLMTRVNDVDSRYPILCGCETVMCSKMRIFYRGLSEQESVCVLSARNGTHFRNIVVLCGRVGRWTKWR